MSVWESRPLAAGIGAEIFGLDLSSDLNADAVRYIRQALLTHGVVFFRGQKLSEDQHIAVAKKFGEPEVHPIVEGTEDRPEIIRIDKPADEPASFGTEWHSDNSFFARPSLGTILYAEEIPPVGGDTLFADMYGAYDALSGGMKSMLDGIRAIHSAKVAYDPAGSAGAKFRGEATLKYKYSDAVHEENAHPVVRTHPESGRKAIYVNPMFTLRFENMTDAESKPLLDYLYQHSTRPEFTCRFHWQKGSVAFWDNRGVMHYAMNDYVGHRRVMNRITLEGDKPR